MSVSGARRTGQYVRLPAADWSSGYLKIIGVLYACPFPSRSLCVTRFPFEVTFSSWRSKILDLRRYPGRAGRPGIDRPCGDFVIAGPSGTNLRAASM
jgi:hypothetical protein